MECDESIRGLDKKVATPLEPSLIAGECKFHNRGGRVRDVGVEQRSNSFLGVGIYAIKRVLVQDLVWEKVVGEWWREEDSK